MKFSAWWVLLGAAVGLASLLGWARTRVRSMADPRAGWLAHPEEHKVTPEMLGRTGEWVGRPAAAFRAPASDGRTYDLAEITRERPLLLLFVKEDCPCSAEAQPYFNRLFANHGDAATFLGVIDGGEAVALEWSRRRKADFPLLLDPELKITKSQRAENSVYVVLIAPGGKIDAYWPGISEEMLLALNARLARLRGVPEKPIDTTDAPVQMVSGCPYLE